MNEPSKKKRKIQQPMEEDVIERIDLEATSWILVNFDRIKTEEQKKALRYFWCQVKYDGKLPVHYEKKEYKIGRLYAEGALSVQSLSTFIRGLLTQRYCHDIDIANCHPVLLRVICQENGWNHDMISDYIDHREDRLREIMVATGCTRGNAKLLMLRMTFGGSWENWLKEFKLDETIPCIRNVKNYSNQIRRIGRLADRKYAHFPKNKEKKFSRLAYVLQDFENRVLHHMIEFFKQKGYDPAVLMYDGLMIYRKIIGSTGPLDESLIRECEVVLHTIFGCHLPLEEKPITSELTKDFEERGSGMLDVPKADF